jgi:8-oxo-dGTP diphosphatase
MPHIYTPENLYANSLLPKQIVVALGAVRDKTGRALVACRRDSSIPDATDKWEFVGGKVEFGEQPEDALVREVGEETTLKVKIKRLLPKVFTNIWTTTTGQQVQVFLLTYECEVVSGKLSNKNVKDEISELKFVSLDELKSMDTLPNVAEAIQFL